MDLQERLQEDMKAAMRRRDAARLSVIRYLRAEIHNAEISRQAALDDDGVIDVLGRQAKQRRDSIEAFKAGDRQDLVDKEEAELSVILEYLPQQLSADEIATVAQAAIDELGATGPRDMGKVMGRIVPHLRGKADGKAVSSVVSRLLGPQAG